MILPGNSHRKRTKPNNNLSQKAYYLIREKILTGRIPLGGPLSRRGLARELGMSFLPISQAIERLEYEELVESLPRVGTRVTMPTPQNIREHYLLREALECQAARLFAEKATSKQRLEMQKIARRVDKMLSQCGADTDAGTIFRTQAFHMSFHMKIVECTGSVALSKALERTQVLTFNWLYDISAKLTLPGKWHGQLMDALAGRDCEVAERAMRTHINFGLQQIQKTLAQQSGPGRPGRGRASEKSPRAVSLGWRKRTVGRSSVTTSK